jgi:DNA mismatch repair protein MutS2
VDFSPGDRVHFAGLGTGIVRDARGLNRYAVEIKGRVVIAHAMPRAAVQLDLHGKTAAEAAELVEAFVDDALRAGHAELRIIHGRSGGRVKAAVHQYLKRLAAVRSFSLDPRNAGVTIVSFK